MSWKRPRRRGDVDPEPLDSLLARAGENRFAARQPPIPERVWREIVGLRVADRARPVSIDRGVLVLLCATSAWANELSMLGATIVERLRERRFAVDAIRFRVGAVEPPPRPPERRATRVIPPPAPLPPELVDQIRKVDDDDLRESIALAASSNLAWQTYVAPSVAPPSARAPRSAKRGSAPPDRS